MRRFLLAPAAAAVLGAAGCASTAAVMTYEPTAAPAVRLPGGLPRLLVEEPSDNVGRGLLQGPVQVDARVNWGELVREALPKELARVGWPLAQTRALSGARLKASVVRVVAKWNAGFGVRVDGDVKFLLTLKEADGREVWEGELIGKGAGTAGGGGVPGNGIRQAWAAALADAMSRLGPLLDAEQPWRLLGKPAGALAASPAAPAPSAPLAAAPRSDVDELPAQRGARKAHAVVIGIERYRENLPAADFAAGDARLAAEYFKRLGVPEENVALLTDGRATRGDFEKYFERWLPNRVEAGDEVYVYFSGHGAPNPAKGDAYLVPYDGDPTYIEQTGYPLAKLYAQLAKLPAKRVLVAMDSCFSGAGGRSVIAKGARPLVSIVSAEIPAKVVVLSASAGDQISNSYQEKGHGLFTYFLLKGLKEKGADFKAVFDYLKPEVAKIARREYNADQDPQWREGK